MAAAGDGARYQRKARWKGVYKLLQSATANGDGNGHDVNDYLPGCMPVLRAAEAAVPLMQSSALSNFLEASVGNHTPFQRAVVRAQDVLLSTRMHVPLTARRERLDDAPLHMEVQGEGASVLFKPVDAYVSRRSPLRGVQLKREVPEMHTTDCVKGKLPRIPPPGPTDPLDAPQRVHAPEYIRAAASINATAQVSVWEGVSVLVVVHFSCRAIDVMAARRMLTARGATIRATLCCSEWYDPIHVQLQTDDIRTRAARDSTTLCTDAGMPARESQAAVTGASSNPKVYLGEAITVVTPTQRATAMTRGPAAPSRKFTAWLNAQPSGGAWVTAFARQGKSVDVSLTYAMRPPSGLPNDVRWSMAATPYLGPLNRRAFEQRRRNTPKNRRKKAIQYAAFLQHVAWSGAALARDFPDEAMERSGEPAALDSLPEEWWPHSVVPSTAPPRRPCKKDQPLRRTQQPSPSDYPGGYDSLASALEGFMEVRDDESSSNSDGDGSDSDGSDSDDSDIPFPRGAHARSGAGGAPSLQNIAHSDGGYEGEHDSDSTDSEGQGSDEGSYSDYTLEEGGGAVEDEAFTDDGSKGGVVDGAQSASPPGARRGSVGAQGAAEGVERVIPDNERVLRAGVAAVQLLPHWPLQAHEHCFSLQLSALVRFAVRLSEADEAVWKVWEEATRRTNEGDQVLHSSATTAAVLPMWLKRALLLRMEGVERDQTLLFVVLGTMNASTRNLRRLLQIPESSNGGVGDVDMILGDRLEAMLAAAGKSGTEVVVRGGGRKASARKAPKALHAGVRETWKKHVEWSFVKLMHLHDGDDERPALWAMQVPPEALSDAGCVEHACSPAHKVRSLGADWAPKSSVAAAKLVCALARLLPLDRLMGKHTAGHHCMGSVMEATLEALLGWPPVHAVYEEVLGAPLVAAQEPAQVFDVAMLLSQLSMPMPAMLTTPCIVDAGGAASGVPTRSPELLTGYAFRSATARVSSLGQYTTPIASNLGDDGQPLNTVDATLSMVWPSYASNKDNIKLVCLEEQDAMTLLGYALNITRTALRESQGEVWAYKYAAVVTVPYVPRVQDAKVGTAVTAARDVSKHYSASVQHELQKLVQDAQTVARQAQYRAELHGGGALECAWEVLIHDATQAPALDVVPSVMQHMRELCKETACMAAAAKRLEARDSSTDVTAEQWTSVPSGGMATGGGAHAAPCSAFSLHLQCAAASLALQHAYFALCDTQLLDALRYSGLPQGAPGLQSIAQPHALEVPQSAPTARAGVGYPSAVLPVFRARNGDNLKGVDALHRDVVLQLLRRDADTGRTGALSDVHRAWREMPAFVTMALPQWSPNVHAPPDRLSFYDRDVGASVTPWCLFPADVQHVWDVAVEDGTYALSVLRRKAEEGVPVTCGLDAVVHGGCSEDSNARQGSEVPDIILMPLMSQVEWEDLDAQAVAALGHETGPTSSPAAPPVPPSASATNFVSVLPEQAAPDSTGSATASSTRQGDAKGIDVAFFNTARGNSYENAEDAVAAKQQVAKALDLIPDEDTSAFDVNGGVLGALSQGGAEDAYASVDELDFWGSGVDE